jgi:hypothetical protein
MYSSEKMIEYDIERMRGWNCWRWKVVKWSTLVINPSTETVSDKLTRKQAEGLVKLLEGIRDEQS